MRLCAGDFAMLTDEMLALVLKLPPRVPPAFKLHSALTRIQRDLNKTKSGHSLKRA